MARTRAQDKDSNTGRGDKTNASKKRSGPDDIPPSGDNNKQTTEQKPTGHNDERSAKAAKKEDDYSSIDNPTLRKLLSDHGTFPLQDTGLSNPTSPTAPTVLAHVFHALLTSTRISHKLAAKTLRVVINAGYADLATLEKSSWEDRTKVLTEGGYTHYREKTATELGELAELVRSKYDGDFNNLLIRAKGKDDDADAEAILTAVRKGLSEIKGIGNVALDVFCDTAQGVWHEIAPFLDPRSQKTAEAIGIPSDARELYEAVDKDAVVMCKVAMALTLVRLEKLESDYSKS